MIPYLFMISRKSQQNRENPVTADMTARETFERELRPLEHIKDNYEKNRAHSGSADAGKLQWHSCRAAHRLAAASINCT